VADGTPRTVVRTIRARDERAGAWKWYGEGRGRGPPINNVASDPAKRLT